MPHVLPATPGSGVSGNGRWTAELYEDRPGHYPIETWFGSLTEVQFAALHAGIKHRLEVEGLALARTAWLTPLGDGLYEFRVRHTADEIVRMYSDQQEAPPKGRADILLRMFVHFYGDRVVLLMHGYDKGADTSDKRQNKEIAEARRRLTAWKLAQARTAKQQRRGNRR